MLKFVILHDNKTTCEISNKKYAIFNDKKAENFRPAKNFMPETEPGPIM